MDKVITFSLRRESIDIIIELMTDALCDQSYPDHREEQAYSLLEKLKELSAPVTH